MSGEKGRSGRRSWRKGRGWLYSRGSAGFSQVILSSRGSSQIKFGPYAFHKRSVFSNLRWLTGDFARSMFSFIRVAAPAAEVFLVPSIGAALVGGRLNRDGGEPKSMIRCVPIFLSSR